MKKLAFVICLLVMMAASFQFKDEKEDLAINLFFTRDYEGDSWENHRTGLIWALSYLGAELPKGSFDRSVSWMDSVTFTLQLDKVGFNSDARKSLNKILGRLKKSGQYKKYNCLDMGALVSLTIGSSANYYEITGVPKTLSEFYGAHYFNRYSVFAVSHSAVGKHERILKYKASGPVTDWCFVAEEGAGILEGKIAGAFEVYDVMPNGQLRFAVYDSKGNRLDGSPDSLGKAGKPAKCMWCHEINILPLYTSCEQVENYVSPHQFNADVAALTKRLEEYRKTLNSDIDFSKTQDHTKMELVYISYMQPGDLRLAQEWRVTMQEAQDRTSRMQKSSYDEFPFLGKLVDRRNIKNKGLVLPGSIRETNHNQFRDFK